MIKKIILIISFVFILLCQPTAILAETDNLATPSAETPYDIPEELGFWENLWLSVSSWLKSLFGVRRFSPDVPVPSHNTSQFTTDYTRQDKGFDQKILSDSTKKYLTGIWFNEVLSGVKGYENKIISEADSTCPEIKITDIIYFHYIKNQKILFDRSNPQTPIEYIPSLVEKYKTDLNYPESCFISSYTNAQGIPGGDLHGEDAGLSSTQLNDLLRTTLPYNSQGEETASNDDTSQKAEQLIKDNDKQENTMLLSFIPNQSQNQLVCDIDSSQTREYQRKLFAYTLSPDSWYLNKTTPLTADALPERYDPNGGNASNCAQSGHGRGMSQYGAYGMTLAGFDYTKVLFSYYGGSDMGVSLSKINSSKDQIRVALTEIESDNSCQQLINQYPDRFKLENNNYCTQSSKICKSINNDAKNQLCYDTLTLSIDDYLKGLSEIPTSWSVEVHKAQSVAARTYAYVRTNNLTNAIKNCSYDQVFRCKRLLSNLSQNNHQTIAADQTSNEILTRNGQAFSTEYASCHGKASLTPPYFDGTAYERLARAPVYASDGICESVNLVTSISATQNANGLYIFSGSKHGQRIAEDYDIGQIEGGKWLATYSGSCQLDSRIFPGLDLMVAAFNQNFNGTNTLGFSSCYRSVATQEKLWQKALSKYGSEEEAAKWTARPGTSAHHTGRAIDFSDKNGRLDEFSTAYLWLLQNASQYGFYNYSVEPWHWEYNP